jgi:hypothetical protein
MNTTGLRTGEMAVSPVGDDFVLEIKMPIWHSFKRYVVNQMFRIRENSFFGFRREHSLSSEGNDLLRSIQKLGR